MNYCCIREVSLQQKVINVLIFCSEIWQNLCFLYKVIIFCSKFKTWDILLLYEELIFSKSAITLFKQQDISFVFISGFVFKSCFNLFELRFGNKGKRMLGIIHQLGDFCNVCVEFIKTRANKYSISNSKKIVSAFCFLAH